MRKPIQVIKATGEGNTLIGAFDNALCNAGVANYNLIRLSSVIPEGASVVELDKADINGTWGNKLYCVMAIQYAEVAGEEAHAGIGWAYENVEGGRGLFVEHEGTSLGFVENAIEKSLEDLFNSRGLERGDVETVTSSIVCKDKPVCSFVVAVFEEEGWDEV